MTDSGSTEGMDRIAELMQDGREEKAAKSKLEAERVDVLADIEATWHNQMDLALEAELSINDWIDRIKGASVAAHMNARTDQVMEQYKNWAEIGAIAASRMLLLGRQLP